MKKLGKAIVGLIAAVAMLFTGLAIGAVPAMADGGTTGDDGTGAAATYTLTIKDAVKGHTYKAYQVFEGTLSDSNLTVTGWGSGVKGNEILTALKSDNAFVSGDANVFQEVTDAAGVAAKLLDYQTDSAQIKEFANVVAKHLSDTATGTSGSFDATVKTYTISGLAAGYYLVKDKDGSLTGNDAYTDYILKIVKNATAKPKSNVPTVEKKVHDVNDSASDNVTDPAKDGYWQDSADHDFNDSIDYKLTGTLSSNYDAYTTYAYKFTDTLSKGLTIPTEDNKVTGLHVYAVNGTGESASEVEIASSSYSTTIAAYTGTEDTDPYKGGKVLTVKFANLKAATVATAGETLTINASTKIVVRYTATLNTNAVIGAAGNPNKVDLTYSNNPNGEGTGKTPEDKVTVFTFEFNVNKIKSDGNALAGAKFKLEKVKKNGDSYDVVKDLGEQGNPDTDNTVFTWEGLDDGTYRLTETKNPTGYKEIAPKIFKVVATHDPTNDDPKLTKLELVNEDGSALDADLFKYDEKNATDKGKPTLKVVNKGEHELPETGGIGTVALYVAGAACVIAAGLWFGLRRRITHRH